MLDLAFFSGAIFLPAYVFFGAASVLFTVDGLTVDFAGLAVAVGFLITLAEDGLLLILALLTVSKQSWW